MPTIFSKWDKMKLRDPFRIDEVTFANDLRLSPPRHRFSTAEGTHVTKMKTERYQVAALSSQSAMSANATSVSDAPSEPPPPPELDLAKLSVLSSIIVLTLLGNGFVLISILSRSRSNSYNGKMTRMYYFMLHLSCADILTALLTLLSELIWTLTVPHFYGGNVVCKSVKFAQMIGPYLR